MSRLFIPPLATKFRLTAPWSFVLHREARCRDLFVMAGWDRENVRVSADERSVRSDYRETTYPNGWDKPGILAPPLSQTRFDFGEPVTDPEALVYPMGLDTKGGASWEHANRRSLACLVEGTEVVLQLPVPADAMRVIVYARVRGSVTATVTLPTGSVLAPARYYIRNGASDFDSVTFHLQKPGKNEKPRPHGRFWAKLPDVNRIEYELVEAEAQPWWHAVSDRLDRGEVLVLAHDVAKVPGPVTVTPLRLRSVMDLPDAAWLVYAEGSRVHFWLRDRAAPFTHGSTVPGSTFGTGKQFRGDELPVEKVRGYVSAVEGL